MPRGVVAAVAPRVAAAAVPLVVPVTASVAVPVGAAGAVAALRRAGGWRVESDPRAPLCSFHWAPHGLIRWDRVMDWREEDTRSTNTEKDKETGFVVANHHYARRGLFRPKALADALDAFERGRGSVRAEPTKPRPTAKKKTDSSAPPARRATVRAFALVAGSRASMRVAVRRRVEGLEAFLLETRPETKRDPFAVVAAADCA